MNENIENTVKVLHFFKKKLRKFNVLILIEKKLNLLMFAVLSLERYLINLIVVVMMSAATFPLP